MAEKQMANLVEMAVNGEQQALESLIVSVKDQIYNLSLRMLWNPADAEDVTQEILIKVITNLAKFRGESRFSSWVYKIATNHLINTNKRGLENQELSFDIFEQGIAAGFATRETYHIGEADRNLLAEELKISCTHAMLLCLDREQRLIYILSSIFEINSKEGALIMNVSPETYRKRLSRAREKLRNFMGNNCGLVNPEKLCRCSKRVEVAIENKRINPEELIFVNRPLAKKQLVLACKDEMEGFDQLAGVFASNPYYLTPEKVLQNIKKVVISGNYQIIEA